MKTTGRQQCGEDDHDYFLETIQNPRTNCTWSRDIVRISAIFSKRSLFAKHAELSFQLLAPQDPNEEESVCWLPQPTCLDLNFQWVWCRAQTSKETAVCLPKASAWRHWNGPVKKEKQLSVVGQTCPVKEPLSLLGRNKGPSCKVWKKGVLPTEAADRQARSAPYEVFTGVPA